MNNKLNFLHILSGNGWKWDCYNSVEDAGCRFNMTVLGLSFSYTISAIVAEYPDHLKLSGYYGIQWLEMIARPDASDDIGMTFNDLEDAKAAIICAEDNLVTLGVPFVLDYKFKDSWFNPDLTADEKRKRNLTIREKYGLTTDDNKIDGEEDE